MSKPYHVFTDEELAGKSPAELKAYLTGKVMTCAKCWEARVSINTWEREGRQYYGILCGDRWCNHNIVGNSFALILNDWNAEIDEELEKLGEKALDFATEIVIYNEGVEQ